MKTIDLDPLFDFPELNRSDLVSSQSLPKTVNHTKSETTVCTKVPILISNSPFDLKTRRETAWRQANSDIVYV